MKKVLGKTQGLKSNQLRRLERLYDRHVSGTAIASPELVKPMCEIASELGRVVGVLVDRRGNVTDVMLGDFQRVYLPDIGRSRAGVTRLRGLRLIVVKPKKNNLLKKQIEVDQDLITDLEKLQLDLVFVAESEDGEPGKAVMAVLDANRDTALRHKSEYFSDIYAVETEFPELIAETEAALSHQVTQTHKAAKVTGQKNLAVLVGVYTTPKKVWQPSMRELEELSKTAGVQVVDVVVQQRKELDPRTIVGPGKLEDLSLNALHNGAEMLIFDCDLSPSQLKGITDLTDLKVLDRTMLILDIFARRAKSKGGKMQVELAQLRYSLPRLADRQTGLSRLTGGIGGVGPGETKLEIDKRRVKDKISRVEKEIDKLRQDRQLRRKLRNTNDVPIISIVGYTNAGKSTLLNKLTGADAYAKNELFATLDTTSRRLRFPSEKEVIITDTVGFIRNLPAGLLNAFRATLEELHDADLLLHVVDGSDSEREQHIHVVNEILRELEIDTPNRILVMNKTDLLKPGEIAQLVRRLGVIPISAQTGQGLKELVKACEKEIFDTKAPEHVS